MVVSLLQGSCVYPWHDTSEFKQNSLCPFQTYIGKGTALNVEKVKSLSMQVRTFPYIRGVLIKHDYEWLAISWFSTEKRRGKRNNFGTKLPIRKWLCMV